jgi:hypothetical protein
MGVRADHSKRLAVLERGTEYASDDGTLLDLLNWFDERFAGLVDWNLFERLEEAAAAMSSRAYTAESARIVVDYVEAAGKKNPDAEAEFWRRVGT